MKRYEVIELGFKPLPNFNIGDHLIFELPRNRHLSLACVGNPNEMLCICATDIADSKHVTDVIVLHNYDYNGYITKETLIDLITLLNK